MVKNWRALRPCGKNVEVREQDPPKVLPNTGDYFWISAPNSPIMSADVPVAKQLMISGTGGEVANAQVLHDLYSRVRTPARCSISEEKRPHP